MIDPEGFQTSWEITQDGIDSIFTVLWLNMTTDKQSLLGQFCSRAGLGKLFTERAIDKSLGFAEHTVCAANTPFCHLKASIDNECACINQILFTDTEIWISCDFHVLWSILLLLICFQSFTNIKKHSLLMCDTKTGSGQDLAHGPQIAHFSQESDQWFSYSFTHFYRHRYLVTVHYIISHSVLTAELSNKSYVHLPPPADKTSYLQQEEIPGAWCSGSKGTTHRRRRKLKITKWVREPWESFWSIVRLH